MARKRVELTTSGYAEKTHPHDAIGHRAFHDALTGLPNRDLFFERMSRELARVRRYESSFALMMLDLDEFDAVNGSNGHEAGDLVLCDVAKQLVSTVRDVDTVARTGGDEFAILLDGVTNKKDAEIVALKIIKSMSAPIKLEDGSHIKIGASVGIVFSPLDGSQAEQLMLRADQAMSVAKSNGKGLIGFSKSLPSASRKPEQSTPLSPTGEMTLGISIMDEQHKAMANFIRGLTESLSNGDRSTKLLKRVELLVELCQIHFKTEEELMELHQLAGLEEHRTEHQSRLKDLRAIFRDMHFTKQGMTAAAHAINGWMAEHISGQDTELAAQLKDNGVS